MNIWLSADHHWGHPNIIKHCHRPFDSIDEHDHYLIESWNQCVKPNDHVMYIGDMFMRCRRDRMVWILKQLNGKLHLVYGNHDKDILRGWAEKFFIWRKADYFLDVGEPQKAHLYHYPLDTWRSKHYGAWHLHGHSHGNLPSRGNELRLDVGIDCHNYRPIHLDEIRMIFKSRQESQCSSSPHKSGSDS